MTETNRPKVVTLGALPAHPPKGMVFVVRFQYCGHWNFYKNFLIESGAESLRMRLYAMHSPPSRGCHWLEYSTRKPGAVGCVAKAAAQILGVTSSVRLDKAVKL